ncbi:MAG: aspartate aminotransferase family protein [Planctomycetaceae bacterium]|nr:aspartate aminotransferase family protein [Planctomycetaceae bacterium]
MPSFELEPREVAPVDTKYRKIVTQLPVPESIPILKTLRTYEPMSMTGQPLVVWDRAEGTAVHDRWGNMWLDFSSGVLVTNAGHTHPRIKAAVLDQVEHGLMHNYCFPSEVRADLVEGLTKVAPEGLKKVFILTTGSETTECAIKLARTHGLRAGGEKKITMVTFNNAFHGRTMGAQMAGGAPALKEWIVNLDPAMVQVPFPDGFRQKDVSFDVFLRSLEEQGVKPDQVAGVMSETYQGGGASFAPPAYMQALRKWCDEHNVVLIFDEVQAGFGRCGKYWGFEHYGVVPDLFCCGKGISSGLPLSAVFGRPAIMDQYPPGSMTSTHTGNPVCAAAALANLDVIEAEGLVENAEKMGAILHELANAIRAKHSDHLGPVGGKGLVAAMQFVKPGTTEPDGELAFEVVRAAVERGLMLFAPVGAGGGSIKLNPPLSITEDALRDGVSVFAEALDVALAGAAV